MTLLEFLNANKTKITGALLAVFGFLQASTTVLQELMSPKAFGWFTVAVGCFVAFLGFLNSHKDSQ